MAQIPRRVAVWIDSFPITAYESKIPEVICTEKPHETNEYDSGLKLKEEGDTEKRNGGEDGQMYIT